MKPKTRKPETRRTRIEDIRRAELVQAAHRVFIERGLSGLTSARICEEAGMSPGILAYYFKGKDELLFGMVRYNNRVLMEDVIARLRQAESGWERFLAIVEGNFPAQAFERNTANAWLSVCAAAGTHAQYARLQRIFYARLFSNLASAFTGAVAGDRLERLALGVGTLIDGLWLRKASGESIARETAIALIVSHAEAMLSEAERAALKRPAPARKLEL